MRRNHIFIIVLFMAGLTATRCEKFLEEMPQNKLKPSTTEDYEQLLNNAYFSQQIVPYLDPLADDLELLPETRVSATTVSAGDRMLGAYLWYDNHEETMTSTNGDIAFRELYKSIYYTNVVIENIDDAIGMELNEANVRRIRNNIKGEAMAMRAYCYFYLVNLYAKHYDPETAAIDPGVPLNLSTGAEDQAYTRNTIQEIYNQIIADLTQGIRLMEENPIKKIGKVKFNPLSAKAMLARVYLYVHQWDSAIEYASAVTRENSNIFNLHEAGELLNFDNNTRWTTAASGATIDYLGVTNNNVIFESGINENYPTLSYYQTQTTFGVNRELAAQYEENDVRRLYFMDTYTQTLGIARTRLTYRKHRTHSSLHTGLNTPMGRSSGCTRVIRIEEMYLILAEANVRKSSPDISGAVGYLNYLREPKFKEGTYIPLSASNFNQQSLIDYVALERRRELCFEGHRWFDLRRTTRPAMVHIGYNDEIATLQQDDPRYVLQIPLRELSTNPEIGPNPRNPR